MIAHGKNMLIHVFKC
jgi:hypothetical protein